MHNEATSTVKSLASPRILTLSKGIAVLAKALSYPTVLGKAEVLMEFKSKIALMTPLKLTAAFRFYQC